MKKEDKILIIKLILISLFTAILVNLFIHYSKKLKEHIEIKTITRPDNLLMDDTISNGIFESEPLPRY